MSSKKSEIFTIPIVDDHLVVRKGLAGMLAGQPDFKVVGMPGLDGVGAIEVIKAQQPQARVLVLTTYDSDADILRAIEAGATDYLLKDTPREELFRAMRGPPEESLSAREIEVLQLVARGASNKEIGKALHISTATVKTHLIHIYGKLGLDDRTTAVTTAPEKEIISLE